MSLRRTCQTILKSNSFSLKRSSGAGSLPAEPRNKIYGSKFSQKVHGKASEGYGDAVLSFYNLYFTFPLHISLYFLGMGLHIFPGESTNVGTIRLKISNES